MRVHKPLPLYLAVAAVMPLTQLAVAQALPPTITKAFAAPSVGVGSQTFLSFTIANPNAAVNLTGIGFVDMLPAGLGFFSPHFTSICTPGSVPGMDNFSGPNSQNYQLTNLSLAANGSCTLTATITGLSAGVQLNTTGPIFSNQTGNGPTSNTASINVIAPPTLLKTFGMQTIPFNGVTALTFTLINFNQSQLSGISFTDPLPAGLIVATPNGAFSNCGVAIAAVPGSQSISVTGVTLSALSSCMLTVNVQGVKAGSVSNQTSSVTSTEGGTGTAASASATVANPAEAFQVRYFSNLSVGDSVINLTNTGASSSVSFPTQDGNLCVSVYAFSPDEQLVSCCSCLVTPNGLASLSVHNDLISNTLTPGVPTSLVVKLFANSGTPAGACNAGSNVVVVAPGLSAWATTIHPVPPAGATYAVTETPFTQSTLSDAERTRITSLCSFIQSNGSGFGLCRSCRFGALGAIKSSQ